MAVVEVWNSVHGAVLVLWRVRIGKRRYGVVVLYQYTRFMRRCLALSGLLILTFEERLMKNEGLVLTNLELLLGWQVMDLRIYTNFKPVFIFTKLFLFLFSCFVPNWSDYKLGWAIAFQDLFLLVEWVYQKVFCGLLFQDALWTDGRFCKVEAVDGLFKERYAGKLLCHFYKSGMSSQKKYWIIKYSIEFIFLFLNSPCFQT